MKVVVVGARQVNTMQNPPERDVTMQNPDRDIRYSEAAALVLGIVALNMALLVLFSGMAGLGIQVFKAVARFGFLGNPVACFAALVCVIYFLLDWPHWRRTSKGLALVLPWAIASLAAVLKGCQYPWAPMLMVMLQMLLWIGGLRVCACKQVKRRQFYKVVGITAALCAAVMFGAWVALQQLGDAWSDELRAEMARDGAEIYEKAYSKRELDYADDCLPQSDLSAYSSEERTRIRSACGSAETVLFMIWACPFVGTCCNAVIATFVLLHGVLVGLHDTPSLERVLRLFVMGLTVMVMGMYGSAVLSGSSVRMGGTLMAFFAAGLMALLAWLYLELGSEEGGLQAVLEQVQGSSFAKSAVHKVQNSDWLRALAIGGFGVLIPPMYVLDQARQRLRRCCYPGAEGVENDRIASSLRKLMEELKTWNWASILCKICLLGEIFFTFQVGVAKATYVFLSWMNSQLASLDYGVVIAIIFAIGYTMFLLPPVPGVPVYVFCGVVVAEQGRQLESVGFVGGCAIATALAFCLKLSACTGQYGIGYLLGKSVKVQQLIGVDKVFTRAIEMILRRPGLQPGKVAVLVGGPDWPVSVTCGILRLNVGQMLLGTAPVLIVLAPCVLAGAFMARTGSGDRSIWSVLAQFFMGLSVIGQTASMSMAVYETTRVVDKHEEELQQPREEHKAVAQLTAEEAHYYQVYTQVTAWNTGVMGLCRKAVISAAAVLIVLSGFIFVMMDEACFENFSVSSKIDDPIDENGLGGRVTNIVRPLGAFALLLFATAVFLHVLFVKDAERRARKQQQEEVKQGLTAAQDPQAQVIGAAAVPAAGAVVGLAAVAGM